MGIFLFSRIRSGKAILGGPKVDTRPGIPALPAPLGAASLPLYSRREGQRNPRNPKSQRFRWRIKSPREIASLGLLALDDGSSRYNRVLAPAGRVSWQEIYSLECS
jgi:hypothetical protein